MRKKSTIYRISGLRSCAEISIFKISNSFIHGVEGSSLKKRADSPLSLAGEEETFHFFLVPCLIACKDFLFCGCNLEPNLLPDAGPDI